MSSTVNLKASGLFISPNQLQTPEGSLQQASNIIIRRDNVTEKRRGFKLYGNSFGSSPDRAKQLLVYRNVILRHYNDILQFDDPFGTGNFTNFNGNYLEPDPGIRIKGISANNNFYFTTSEGIKKISSLDSNLTAGMIQQSGGIKAIDISAAPQYVFGLTTGFLPANSTVAYRVVWGYTDANNNLILGTPSSRAVVYNPGEAILVQDLTHVLEALDNVGNNPGSGLINQTNYVNTLKLPITATGLQIKNALVNLVEKLDLNLAFADQVAVAPLQMGATPVTISSGIATITFTSGNPITYLQVGDQVFLNGFVTNPVVKTFNSTTNVNTTTDRITIPTHGYIQGDLIVFTGTLPTGISASTTYYVINPTVNDFQIATTPNGLPVDITATAVGTGTATVTNRGGVLNGVQTITSITSTTLSFNTGVFADITTSNATISGGSFRGIIIPPDPSTPATGGDITNLQTYLGAIITQLQLEPITNINQTNLNAFILPLAVTTTENVLVTVNIPDAVIAAGPNAYFFQIYRSSPLTATGSTVLANLTPSDEMRQVYEAFPTAAELAAKVAFVLDIVPDSFAGANLYTNEATGEGILQSNEQPPIAVDINRFKNVVFYANTATKQKTQLSILGISNLISEFLAGRIPNITISDGTTTNTYVFVLGVAEQTELKFGPVGTSTPSGFNSSGSSTYFTINSASNATQYYVWYQLGTSLDPAIVGKTGIKVQLLGPDTNTDVARKTRDAISLFPADFNSFLKFNITIQNATTVNVSTDTITMLGHGFVLNEPVTVASDLTIPGGLVAGTQYYIISPATDTFQLSLIPSGAAVNITSVENGNLTVTSRHRVEVINVNEGIATDATTGTLPVGNTVTVLIQGNGEDLTSNPKQVLLSNDVSPARALDQTARSLVRVINSDLGSFMNAFYLSTGATVPGQMLLEAKNLNTPVFYILANNKLVGSSFNPEISPIHTITNISVANPTVVTSANHGLLNGDKIIVSNTNSTPPLLGIFTVVLDPGDPSNKFTVPVNVTVSGTIGVFSKLSDAQNSQNEARINRIYFSKINQPEAVPSVNFFDVGASDKAILRIFPLRDTLFVFKEDGLYRISGEVAPFNLGLFDTSCILIAPDSVDVCGNVIYSWTRQGIQAVSEAGVSTAISRPIDTVILKLGSNNFPAFRTATFGVGYESDNSYIVWTIQKPTDVVATIGFRYSNLTNTWTSYDKTNTCGIIRALDDLLYLGAGDTNFIEQERKTFSRLDYADRELIKNLNLNRYFGTILILDNVDGISIGDALVQDQTLAIYTFNMLLKKLDNDPGIPSRDFFSTLVAVSGDDMRNKLVLLAQKLDTEGLEFTNYFASINNLSGPITSHTQANPTIIFSAAHGLITGRVIAIGGNTSIPSLNGTWTVTVIDADHFSIPINAIATTSTGTWSTLVSSFADLMASYNIIIDKLNIDNKVAYSTYDLITYNTLQEAIITAVNPVTKQVTLSLKLDYIVGPVTIFKAIVSNLTYTPVTMGDPLNWKHLYEATIMFDNKAFTGGTLSFATDLLPQFIDVPFKADTNGIFGFVPNFGDGFFGGASNGAPFRTYIPRNAQRCRYMNVMFTHQTARENVMVYGITLTGSVGLSPRAYRG